jgi:excisionase family DNA binding protein
MAKKQAQQPQKFLTLAAVALLLGCSKRTARRRIDAGCLQAVREGGVIKVLAWSVDGYIASLQPVRMSR